MNKVLIKVLIPVMDLEYELFIPVSKAVGKIKQIVFKRVLEEENISLSESINLYASDGNMLDINEVIKNTSLNNGSLVIII